MTILTDGMLLYHASYLEISTIDLEYCRKGLDFGRGFYTRILYDDLLFPNILEKLEPADVVGGKIANDRTRRTLIDYITGAYGRPGTERADQLALEMLLPNRLQDQFCFRTEAGIQSLEFIRSERYGDIKRCTDES